MNKKLIKLTTCAILLAMAITLDLMTSMIPGLNLSMPLGGRFFGLALLPLLLIGFILGPTYGIGAGILYGILGFFNDGYGLAFFADTLTDALLVFFLDYIIAFGALGITGFFKKGLKKPLVLILAISLALTLRFISSTIVGAILWATYASYHPWTQNLYNNVGQSALLYSAIYNGLYSLSTLILILIIAVLIRKRINELTDTYILGHAEKEDIVVDKN